MKYSVYGIMTASKFVGEYEANSEEEAKEKAQETGDCHVSLCWQCSHEVDVGDIYEYQAEEAV